MKTLILLTAILLTVGCGKDKHPKDETNKETPSKGDDNNGTTAKPVKELTLREKAIGTYEIKEDGNVVRSVFLENGITEAYLNGKKTEHEGKWKIVDGEIHANDDGGIVVFSINKDGSITAIAEMTKDGKRRDIPKDNQIYTYKKIK